VMPHGGIGKREIVKLPSNATMGDLYKRARSMYKKDFLIIQNVPKKHFPEDSYGKRTLHELGLYPRASLIVQPENLRGVQHHEDGAEKRAIVDLKSEERKVERGKHVLELKKKRDKEKEDRVRILELIEDDKVDRHKRFSEQSPKKKGSTMHRR
jgi:hypothetical protein